MDVPNEDITILVADDVFTNIEFLRYILRKENYSILPVSNGAEAIEAVQGNKVDLILLDVMMPDLDGFEVCRRLKDDNAYRDIPIIFLTARTDIESTVKGFELGAVDYITKPFHRQELLARVKNHIELQKTREEHQKANSHYHERINLVKENSTAIISELDKKSPDLDVVKNLTSEIQKTVTG